MKTSFKIYQKRNKLILITRTNGKAKWETLNFIYYEFPKDKKERDMNENSEKKANWLKVTRGKEWANKSHGLDYLNKEKKTVLELFEDLIATKQNSSRSTILAYNRSFKIFKEFLESKNIIDLSFRQLNKGFVKEYKRYLLQSYKHLKGGTIHTYFARFKSLLVKAVDEEYIEHNPSYRISISYECEHHIALNEFEIDSLLNTPYSVFPEVYRHFIEFSMFTGVRFSDAKNMKWEYFRWTIDIEGDEILQFRYWVQKTKHWTKWITLIPDAVKKYEELKTIYGYSPNMFPNLHYNIYYNKGLQKWVDDAGIDKKITSHCMRATFATLWYKFTNNPNIKTLTQAMGKLDEKSTMVYLHSDEDTIRLTNKNMRTFRGAERTTESIQSLINYMTKIMIF